MQKYVVNNFFVNVSVLAVVFRLQFSKNRQFWLKLLTYFANNFKKKDKSSTLFKSLLLELKKCSFCQEDCTLGIIL